MTSLPEQLSAARNAQLDAQFSLLHSITDRALDNASRLMALSLALSRESVERSSRTISQLLGASGPHGLGLLRSHAEEQVRSMAAYGRDVLGIATGIQAWPAPLSAPVSTPAPATLALPAPTRLAQTAIEAGAPAAKALDDAAQAGADIIDTVADSASQSASDAASGTVAAAPEAAADAADVSADAVADATAVSADAIAPAADAVADAASEAMPTAAPAQEQPKEDAPVVVQLAGQAAPQSAPAVQPAPVSKQKAIAKAAGKGASKAAVAQHPLAAPVQDKDSATVTRIDAGSPKRRK